MFFLFHRFTSLRARNGRIWFATASGPRWSLPDFKAERTEQANAVLAPSPSTISSMMHKPSSFLGRHRVTFKFTAPVRRAEQVSFRYRLNDGTSGWVDAGTHRCRFRPDSYV